MLEGILYETVSLSKEEAVVRMLGGSDIYKAHFPGFPITPGVALVQIAVDLLSKIEGKRLDVSAARNIRFLSPVIPSSGELLLTYRFGEGGDVRIFMDDKLCSTLSMTCVPGSTVIIIPTYNNAGTLEDILRRCAQQELPMIVVNDGSTDATPDILEAMKEELPRLVEVIRLPSNKGKGYALKRGFKAALARGYEYAVTLDSDGQHFPEDIPVLLGAARENTLVIGSRNLRADGMPSGNRFANNFSNFWFTVQTLQRIPDTQTGFRVYPLRSMGGLGLMTWRYEAELLVLVFSAWKGVNLVPRPVRIAYPEDRVSHFRPFGDFFRISLTNVALCVATLVYGYPRMLLVKLLKLRRPR